MNRVCSYCGNAIEDISKYRINFCCPKCGHRIEEGEEDCGLMGFGKFQYR